MSDLVPRPVHYYIRDQRVACGPMRPDVATFRATTMSNLVTCADCVTWLLNQRPALDQRPLSDPSTQTHGAQPGGSPRTVQRAFTRELTGLTVYSSDDLQFEIRCPSCSGTQIVHHDGGDRSTPCQAQGCNARFEITTKVVAVWHK